MGAGREEAGAGRSGQKRERERERERGGVRDRNWSCAPLLRPELAPYLGRRGRLSGLVRGITQTLMRYRLTNDTHAAHYSVGEAAGQRQNALLASRWVTRPSSPH